MVEQRRAAGVDVGAGQRGQRQERRRREDVLRRRRVLRVVVVIWVWALVWWRLRRRAVRPRKTWQEKVVDPVSVPECG